MALDLNPAKNDTSTLLDALRALASFAVLIGHGISFFRVAGRLQPPHFPYVQNLAVIGFFVLSGFLIAYVLDRRPGLRVADFLIDRFARIYSSFAPAMVLIGCLAWLLYSAGGLEHSPSLVHWLGNLLMLNGYSNTICEPICIPNFQTAGHLWSLAVEFHIYVFVGLLFVGLRDRSPPLLIASLFFAWVPYIYFGATEEMRPGNGLSYMWMLGFAAYFLTSRIRISRPASIAMVVVSLYMLRHTIRPENEYQIANYIWAAAGMVGLVALSQTTKFFLSRPRVASTISYLASFSFSLYLIHHPMQFALWTIWPNSGWLGAIAAIVLPLPVAIGLAELGEKRHKLLAGRLKSWFTARPA